VHTDIPTRADLEGLLSVRDAACVSIYVPTAPEERGERDRIAFRNLAGEAIEQLGSVEPPRGALDELREELDALADDTGLDRTARRCGCANTRGRWTARCGRCCRGWSSR
jgi:hypothetical protein